MILIIILIVLFVFLVKKGEKWKSRRLKAIGFFQTMTTRFIRSQPNKTESNAPWNIICL